MRLKKIAQIGKNCVACGVCKKTCPTSAVSIYRGMFAQIDVLKCVGCGKCAKSCSAGIISIVPKERSA